MKSTINKILFEHPASVEESYFQHMRFSFGFARGMFFAAGAALIHCLIPCLCEKTASNKISELYSKIKNR